MNNKKIIISLSVNKKSISVDVFDNSVKPLIPKIKTTLSDLQSISNSVQQIVGRYYLTNKVNNKIIESKLKLVGKQLYQILFKNKFQVKLDRKQVILFSIDKELTFIPFELIYSGNFWGVTYQITRQIKFKESVFITQTFDKFKTVILSNPTEDKQIEKILSKERKKIYKILNHNKNILLRSLYSGRIINKNFFIESLFDNNIIYFSGHSTSETSKKNFIELYRSKLKPEHLKDFDLSHIFLLFFNSCQSAFVKHKSYFKTSLLYVFLRAGVKNYIGNMFNIKPEASYFFAVNLFKNFISGNTLGEAILKARIRILKKYGISEIAWFSYNFYGNPYDRIKTASLLKVKLSITLLLLISAPMIIHKFNTISNIKISKKTLAILPINCYDKKLLPYALQKTEYLYKKFKEKYKIIEREKLEDILNELKLSETKYINKNTAVKIGNLISAQYLLYGSIYKIGNSTKVTYRLINVSTSEIIFIKTDTL